MLVTRSVSVRADTIGSVVLDFSPAIAAGLKRLYPRKYLGKLSD